MNIFDATDAPRDSRGRAVGKKRKSLGIKLKRCVQVVWPTYKTSGMKRIVLVVVRRSKRYSHYSWSIYIVRFWTSMWMFSLQSVGFWDPGQFVHLIYCDRMRTVQDKQMVNIIKIISVTVTRNKLVIMIVCNTTHDDITLVKNLTLNLIERCFLLLATFLFFFLSRFGYKSNDHRVNFYCIQNSFLKDFLNRFSPWQILYSPDPVYCYWFFDKLFLFCFLFFFLKILVFCFV